MDFKYKVADIPRIEMVGGSCETFVFDLFDISNGEGYNLTGATVNLKVCPYGNYTTLLFSKTATVSGSKCTFELTTQDTVALVGKFIYHIEINFSGGKKLIPALGEITILPPIG